MKKNRPSNRYDIFIELKKYERNNFRTNEIVGWNSFGNSDIIDSAKCGVCIKIQTHDTKFQHILIKKKYEWNEKK